MKKLSLLLISSSLIFAQATLCYKANWKNLSQIESVALDGGACEGKYSAKDMQKKGWSIKDIQISKAKDGFNYNYIFQKVEKKDSLNKTQLKQAIIDVQNANLKAKKEAQLNKDIQEGEKIYQTKCSNCHGKKGELEPYGNSRKLNSMSLDELITANRDYGLSERDNGTAIIMNPYTVIEEDINKIYKYLKSINK